MLALFSLNCFSSLVNSKTEEIDSIELFANFKPESDLYPKTVMKDW